jgi:hypothetical protein
LCKEPVKDLKLSPGMMVPSYESAEVDTHTGFAVKHARIEAQIGTSRANKPPTRQVLRTIDKQKAKKKKRGFVSKQERQRRDGTRED